MALELKAKRSLKIQIYLKFTGAIFIDMISFCVYIQTRYILYLCSK